MGHATIELARVKEGWHLIDEDDTIVKFKVTEPVVILPALTESFGKHTNLRVSGLEMTTVEAMADNRQCVCLPIYESPSHSLPMAGIVVFPEQLLHSRWLAEDFARWQTLAPGAKSLTELQKSWRHLYPGFWVVRHFGVYLDNDCRIYHMELGERGEHVELVDGFSYEIWT